jgi:hypothetical protein
MPAAVLQALIPYWTQIRMATVLMRLPFEIGQESAALPLLDDLDVERDTAGQRNLSL